MLKTLTREYSETQDNFFERENAQTSLVTPAVHFVYTLCLIGIDLSAGYDRSYESTRYEVS